MAEHYDAETLAVSRRLYDQVRAWGEGGGVTLLGGWAVYARVDALVAQQSRDVDLVVHDIETLLELDRRLKGWGLQWRRHGRTRFNDAHLVGDDPKNIRLDVFKATDFEERLFRGPRMHGPLVKHCATKDWLPSVEFLVRDKLETIPKRVRDASDKRLKDFVDIHNLVFHNTEKISARDLADATAGSRARAAPFLETARVRDAEVRDGAYAEALEVLADWLGP